MKVERISQRFIKNDGAKGDCTGDWTAIPHYEFRLTTHKYYREPTVRMEVFARLIVDFAGGGEMDYFCEVVYNLTNIVYGFSVDELVNIAHEKLPIDLEELFINSEVFYMSSPTFNLWHPYDRETLVQKLSKAIDDYNQRLQRL